MPVIVEETAYNGALSRIDRLGLSPLVEEVRTLLRAFRLDIEETPDANGGAAVRQLIDAEFRKAGNWVNTRTGGIDWQKCLTINGTRVCLGVEVQVSARSDMIAVDLLHLREALVAGAIDVALIIVPSDGLSVYLTDRAPCLTDAKRHILGTRVDDLPLVLIAIQHDGAGPALAKQKTRQGK